MPNNIVSSILSKSGAPHLVVAAAILPFMPRKYREMNQWDQTSKINDEMSPVAFRAGEVVLHLPAHSISGHVYPNERGIYGYIIVKYAGTTNELIEIRFRPNDSDAEQHDVDVSHHPDMKEYRDDGSVSKWVSEDSFYARKMGDVSFTGKFASYPDEVGTESFFKSLFRAVVQHAPYSEQDDSLAKKASRFVDTQVIPRL